MEAIVSRMVKDFEDGKVTRRQLIKSLSIAAAMVHRPRSAAGQARSGFETVALDHISYQVADYRRTRDFYAELMGMTVSRDDGTSQCDLEFGDSVLIARNRRQRAGQPPGDSQPTVDHIAYKIANWNTNAVKAELERRGLSPRLDTGGDIPNYVSFHVSDPDGFDLQISGIAEPGDSQYEKPGP
ncbi:MAG TPA: VOC family protein [Vicinamibacteria bacterium]|nr:VOC family protein [Vicinamibacteria bacterium]